MRRRGSHPTLVGRWLLLGLVLAYQLPGIHYPATVDRSTTTAADGGEFPFQDQPLSEE